MDFLDSIDIKTKEKKSNRVRSWYLYEQFKSLERNQLDAAQKLKDRSYQDRILRQELSERRARRKLYDQFGLCHSESCIDKTSSERNNTTLSVSTDDFFESFCELQEEEELTTRGADRDTDTEDDSQDDSQTGKRYLDDFKSLDSIKDDRSLTESVNSVVQKYKSNENFTEDLKDEIKLVKNSIAEEINLQFETVKENLQCLEKYTKLCEDKISEVDSTDSFGDDDCLKAVSARISRDSDVNLYNIWSKLVSFAYQVIQLNHGNCYYDYSSQFLTAVLACDVLRRGVNKMCHILQPYVSPIKFATDDESDAETVSHKNTKRKKSCTKKIKKPAPKKTFRQRNNNTRTHNKYVSDQYWRNLPNRSLEGRNKEKHKLNYASHRVAKFPLCKNELCEKSSCSIWPSLSASSTCGCPCHAKVINPMLKIGEYIDRILQDIEDCKRV